MTIQSIGIWLKGSSTNKFQHYFGESGDIYYSRTIVRFNRTSTSGPCQIYFTVHINDNGGDLNTYPEEFKNQMYILAYGITGDVDNIDSDVYDKHKAYVIDKTKMEMLVPLDMNNHSLTGIKQPSADSDAVNKKYYDAELSPLKNSFQIYNTRIRIDKDFDLANYNLRNVGNVNNENHISIFGRVSKAKILSTSDIILSFRQIQIGYIDLYNDKNSAGASDQLEILNRDGRKTIYRFTFPLVGRYVRILIDRYFSSIGSIQLGTTNNIGFRFVYKIFR